MLSHDPSPKSKTKPTFWIGASSLFSIKINFDFEDDSRLGPATH